MATDACKLEDLKLSSLIGDINERIYKLRLFDSAAEIHNYCDDLEAEVSLWIESALDHLNKFQEDFKREINEYRTELLKATTSHDDFQVRVDLDSISTDVQQLSNELGAFVVSSLPSNATEDQFNAVIGSKLGECEKRAKQIEKRLRKKTFGNKFMRFRENSLFAVLRDHVGTIEYCSDEGPHLGK